MILNVTWSAVMVDSSSLTRWEAKAVKTLLRRPSFVSKGDPTPKRPDLRQGEEGNEVGGDVGWDGGQKDFLA